MEKETARIEAFSDGIFAIAITLLVLELHVPEHETVRGNHALVQALMAQWPSYLAFTMSFFSIFIMWVNHHKLFKQIYRRNTAVTFANGLILFWVSLTSYPTALLSRYYDGEASGVAVGIYTGLFVLINLSYNLLWYVASRDVTLLRPDMTPHMMQKIRQTYLYGLPFYLAAFGLSFCYPSIALVICVILWVFWALSSGKIKVD